jgi:hypothetical protein
LNNVVKARADFFKMMELTDVDYNHLELFAEKIQGDAGWFSHSNGKLQLDRAAVRDWLNQCDRLLRHMMLVFHLLGGQPARSTEVLSLSYRNNVFHGRNVFVYDGVLFTITAYSKPQWIAGTSSYVPRFLPGIVAKIYVVYNTQILPIRRYLASLMAKDAGISPSDESDSHGYCHSFAPSHTVESTEHVSKNSTLSQRTRTTFPPSRLQ